ncbi:hypothetical protein EDC04DRAFT_2598134 [Pisolithus marmoratus]|nr:hypothetical protein EDC04DRAFT_2598134 [Pisolithus marmoratus]
MSDNNANNITIVKTSSTSQSTKSSTGSTTAESLAAALNAAAEHQWASFSLASRTKIDCQGQWCTREVRDKHHMEVVPEQDVEMGEETAPVNKLDKAKAKEVVPETIPVTKLTRGGKGGAPRDHFSQENAQGQEEGDRPRGLNVNMECQVPDIKMADPTEADILRHITDKTVDEVTMVVQLETYENTVKWSEETSWQSSLPTAAFAPTQSALLMPAVTYLLVQCQPPETYWIHEIGWTDNISTVAQLINGTAQAIMEMNLQSNDIRVYI